MIGYADGIFHYPETTTKRGRTTNIGREWPPSVVSPRIVVVSSIGDLAQLLDLNLEIIRAGSVVVTAGER